jgi:hypothetical protein
MTYNEAKDELFGMANSAILANASLLNGASFDMRWPGVSKPGLPAPTNGFYGRVFLSTINDRQSSLAKLNGQSRYEAHLQLLIQVYSPISVAGASQNGNMFAEAIRAAYRQQSPSGLLSFTNQQVREVGNNDTHYITNVIVTCTYDNIQ